MTKTRIAKNKLKKATKDQAVLRAKISLLDGKYREKRRKLSDAEWKTHVAIAEACDELKALYYTPGQVHWMASDARKKAA